MPKVVDFGNDGRPFFVSASEIANFAGGWMIRCPRRRSHAYLSSAAIDSYHLPHRSSPRDSWARQVLPMVRQVASPCYVST
jgi:hypothetical protein